MRLTPLGNDNDSYWGNASQTKFGVGEASKVRNMRRPYKKFMIVSSLLFSAPEHTLAQEAAGIADGYHSNEEMMTIVIE